MIVANDIRINLDLTGERQAAQGLKNVGNAAEKAGSEFGGMAKDAGQLSKKISETEAEVKRLIKAFDESGDVEFLQKIRKEQSNLRIFERLGKQIASEAADVGEKAGLTLSKSLTDAMVASRGLIIPPLIAAVAGATPVIGAAIGGAVLGGAGIGGIVGGIVAAAQDQRVADEAGRIGRRIGDSFTQAGGPFVEPLIESLRLLDEAGDRIGAKFEEAGAKIAPTLVPLTQGIIGLVEEAMPGFVKGLEAAKPAIRAIGNELPKIGRAVSGFFGTISKDADGAVLAIIGISQAIQATVGATGELIASLASTYEFLVRNGASASEEIEAIFGWLPLQGDMVRNTTAGWRDQVGALDAAKDASGDFAGVIQQIIRGEEEMAVVTKSATEKIHDQITAMDKMFDRVLGAQELASNYQEAIDNLADSVKEHGATLDLDTEAGRSNAKALRDQAEAIKAIRQDIIAKTGDVGLADAAFNQMVDTLYRQMVALGLNKQEADKFAAALRDIPRQAEVEVRAPGLLEAIERAKMLNRLLGGTSAGARARAGDDSGYGGGRASGGPVYPGQTYMVGENGPEVLQMGANGGYVYNNGQTRALMSGASGGAQRDSQPIVVIRTGDARLDALLEMLDLRVEMALEREATLAGAGPR